MGQDIDAVMVAAAKVIAAWDGKKYLKEPVEELRRAIKLTHLESLSNS